MKLVFFGSGPVATASLKHLSKAFQIEAVITKPSTRPDIEKLVKAPVYAASNKQELDHLIGSQKFSSQLGVVVDFGIIVSQEVIDSFPKGIVNSHFSLLPQWRGADPISFALLSGQAKTGVSLMVIEPKLDTGKLITFKSLPIREDDTSPELTSRLVELSNQLLVNFLPLYAAGKVKPKNQPHPERATYSRKLTKEDGLIDWDKSAAQIEREIRTFIDWPKSRTTIKGKEVIITKAHAVLSAMGKPGDIEVLKERGILIIHCGQGYLCIDRLKPAGKNEMDATSFTRGYL